VTGEATAIQGQRSYSRGELYKRFAIGSLILGISLSYLLLSSLRPSVPHLELYALLARSFLQGKTNLPIEPRPELLSLPDPYDPEQNIRYRLQDASLYKGHYYLYFGAVPVILLFLPYRALAGLDLRVTVAVPIFCIAGYLCSCALFFLLVRHRRWAAPFWLQSAIVASLGSTSMVYLILRRPFLYQAAIAAGYLCVMAGFLALGRAILVRRYPHRWFFMAGLLFGLAVGCRPHFVLICAVIPGAFAIRARHSPMAAIALLAGMLVCGGGLCWYNYVRFHDPLEFGRTYQLSSFRTDPASTYYGLELNPGGIFRAAQKFIFLLPEVKAVAPFFYLVPTNPLPGHPGLLIGEEEMVGLALAAPFAFLGFFLPLFLRKYRTTGLLDEVSRWLLYTMYASALSVFCLL